MTDRVTTQSNGISDGRLGGRYRLVEPLAVGGMAVIWRAHDEVLDRFVAVKLLPDGASVRGHPMSWTGLHAEALAGARLVHPNITNVFDYGETRGVQFVVMELLDGQTLAAVLDEGPLPWQHTAHIGAEVAAALAAAHAYDIVHRDIKPANIMLTSSGTKVLDFGIAAGVGATDDADPDAPVLGTPGYLSPERLDGQPLTAATDVYALGVILYRCLAGRLPWSADTRGQMIHAQAFIEPAPLPRTGDAPAPLTDLINQCLRRDPTIRPDSRTLARRLAEIAGITVVLSPLPSAGAGEPLARTAVRPATGEPLPRRRPGRPPGPITPPAPSAQPVRMVSIPVGRPDRRRQLIRIGVAVLAVAAIALAAVMYIDRRAGIRSPAAAATNPAGPAANQVGCWVQLVTRDEPGNRFTARLTVVNTGSGPLHSWTLTVHLSPAYQVTAADGARAHQTGQAVSLVPTVDLPAGKAVTIGLHGAKSGAAPITSSRVDIDDVACAYQTDHVDRPDQPLPPVIGVTEPPPGAPTSPTGAYPGPDTSAGGGVPPVPTPNTGAPPAPPTEKPGVPDPKPPTCGPGQGQGNCRPSHPPVPTPDHGQPTPDDPVARRSTPR